MFIRSTLGAVLAIGVLASPKSVTAQDASSGEYQQLLTEIQSLEAQLAPLQQRALQAPEIRQEQQELTEAVRAAMIESDPEIGAQIERFEVLMTEAQAAQRQGDSDRVAQITTEAMQIQPRIRQAQARALAEPEIETLILAFQRNLQAKMVELDPAAEPLIQRLTELTVRIQQVGGGG